jgi:hypothetical protein
LQRFSSLQVSLLLLPFVSPSRDGKSSSNMETLLTHRDASGGLFIGASMLVVCANEFGTS